MPIELSDKNYWELVNDKSWWCHDSTDPRDWRGIYPSSLGQGHFRILELQRGLELDTACYCLHDDLILETHDREHPLEFTFNLSGDTLDGVYGFYGSGMAPGAKEVTLASMPIQWVSVHMEPALLFTFLGIEPGEVPPEFKHLIRPPDREYYSSHRTTTSTMQTVLQRILQCPYQGLTKRIFLESKVLELLALILEQDREPKSDRKSIVLKPDDVDVMHHARKILLQNLAQPPSLMELARAVGINDHKLKTGFRQIFGTTVFGYLHDCRMEQARQLLEAGDITVAGAARSVGFANRGKFASAFRGKFGVNPNVYRRQKLQYCPMLTNGVRASTSSALEPAP